MTKRWIYSFMESVPEGIDARQLLGAKGFSLSEMTRAGLPVPPGFIISTEACRHYFEKNESWPENLEAELRAHVRRLEQDTDTTFGDTLLLAVRSGAAVSMPGMMDTLLNCGFHADKSDRMGPDEPWEILLKAINLVFKSSRSLRATMYRQRQMIAAEAETAVVIQAMFPSECSGVIFTQDPSDPARGEMVIETCAGYGDQVVAGKIKPDCWRVCREDLSNVRHFSATSAPQLCSRDIEQLCKLALRAERHFGTPLDIEWGMSKGQLALFQCRPIRELETARSAQTLRDREMRRLRELGRGRRKVWLAHNLGETIRFPTPLTWDILKYYAGPDGGLGMMHRDFGFLPSREVAEHGMLELIGGCVYSDLQRASQFFINDLPFSYDLSGVDNAAFAPEDLPLRFDPEKITEATLLRMPALILRLFKCHRRIKSAKANLRQQLDDVVIPGFLDYVQAKRRQDLRALHVVSLIAELNERCVRVLAEFAKEALKPGYFAMEAYKKLRGLLTQLIGREDGLQLSRALTQFEDQFTIDQNVMLSQVAAGTASMEQFLQAYGHRALCDMELAEPRWRENRAYLNELLPCLGDDAKSMRTRGSDHAGSPTSEAELSQLLADHGASSFREELRSYVQDIRELIPLRERARNYFFMGYECIRAIVLEIGRRLNIGNGVFFLTRGELQQLPTKLSQLQAVINDRKSSWRLMRLLHLPPVIDSANLDAAFFPAHEQGHQWKGEAVSAGHATATARVVTAAGGAPFGKEEHVVVCSDFSALWPPLLLNARGLILERGGILSHSAIIARTLGIPAVIFPKATTMIKEGEWVCIDGTTGLISKPAATL
jgi:phosphohistidine swiveling domain-containing protein